MTFERTNSYGYKNEQFKKIQNQSRIDLISSYLVSYSKTLNIKSTYDDKASAFNQFYVGHFRDVDPLKISEIKRLPQSIKNPLTKIQAKGSLESIGEFAGRGSSSQEATDKAYFYIFGRLHRLWSFFHRANALKHLSNDEFYDFLVVESLETIRLNEKNKNGIFCHSIVIIDCCQFDASCGKLSDARKESVEELRKFIIDVNNKIQQLENFTSGLLEESETK